MQEIEKIVILGPESTGKSTLCADLASYYNTLWCPEYAREYLLAHGKTYTYEDLLEIAKGQITLEDDYIKRVVNQKRVKNEWSGKNLLFVDTDMYVMKVWCEYVFDKCHSYILNKITERKASLYLLCNIDLPWVKDELREYPDLESRKELFNIYKDILVNQNVSWAIISGTSNERTELALNIINNSLFT